MMKRLLTILFILSSSQLFLAANTNIQNNDSNLVTRNKLNLLLGQQHNVRQPPYNAAGNGSTND
jgi:hypothetical protein